VKIKGSKLTDVDQCVDEMTKANAQVYPVYEQGVAAGAQPGKVTEYPIDEKQGIYDENVEVPGAPEGVMAVIVIDLEGRPYVVFPVKKGD
jgi:hypothetical protein